MEFRKVFDTIPEQFDKYRPRYSAELFADLIEYAEIGPGKSVLELGPGTGQATDPVLNTGCEYNAIEQKYLKEGDKILDIGAGAGEYSLYFARLGYEVCALELADANIAAFWKKLTPEDKINLVQGNALDLSRYADKYFDIVFLFGPLYHLKNDADKQKCISEAMRVCK